jgi:hypothetical protein
VAGEVAEEGEGFGAEVGEGGGGCFLGGHGNEKFSARGYLGERPSTWKNLVKPCFSEPHL